MPLKLKQIVAFGKNSRLFSVRNLQHKSMNNLRPRLPTTSELKDKLFLKISEECFLKQDKSLMMMKKKRMRMRMKI